MIEWIRGLFKKNNKKDDESQKKDEAYFLANRYYLQSINPEDIDEYLNGLSEQDRKEYEAEASIIFNSRVFKREIKYLLAQQALYVASQVKDWEKSLVGRGTINGIGLVEDRFRILNSRHQENIKPKESFDKYGLIPETE